MYFVIFLGYTKHNTVLRDQEDTVQKLANVLCDIPRLHKANTVLRDLNTLCNIARLHKANTVLRDLNTLCNIPRLHKANTGAT